MERAISAVKAIIRKDGRILVLKTERPERTYWVLPGGRIDYGESPREGLKRELTEELSCEAEIGDVCGVYHFFTGADDNGKQIVATAFRAEIGNQEIDIDSNPIDEGITEYQWLKPEEIIKKSSNEELKRMIRGLMKED